MVLFSANVESTRSLHCAYGKFQMNLSLKMVEKNAGSSFLQETLEFETKLNFCLDWKVFLLQST